MPRIKRWFPVSHDINSDAEVWAMRHQIGEKALSVWLEILSIADRNESELPGDYQELIRSIAGKCQATIRTVSAVFEFAKSHMWLEFEPSLRTRNYVKYHPSRDANKIPQGNSLESPPSLTSLTSLPKKRISTDTTYYAAGTPNGSSGVPAIEWPADLQRVKEVLETLQIEHPPLHDPAYWKTIEEWIEGTGLPIYYLDELKAYMANQRSKKAGAKGRHVDLKAGFRNWLATAVRWKEREHERATIKQRH